MPKKYHVESADDPRHALEARRAGALTLRRRDRVEALPRADRGDADAAIAAALGVAINAVAGLRGRFAEEGLDAAIAERPRRGAPPSRRR